MAAVLVGVMRLLGCPFDGAWSVSYLLAVICVIVGVPCLLCSLAVPGVGSFLRVTQKSVATRHRGCGQVSR